MSGEANLIAKFEFKAVKNEFGGNPRDYLFATVFPLLPPEAKQYEIVEVGYNPWKPKLRLVTISKSLDLLCTYPRLAILKGKMPLYLIKTASDYFDIEDAQEEKDGRLSFILLHEEERVGLYLYGPNPSEGLGVIFNVLVKVLKS